MNVCRCTRNKIMAYSCALSIHMSLNRFKISRDTFTSLILRQKKHESKDVSPGKSNHHG